VRYCPEILRARMKDKGALINALKGCTDCRGSRLTRDGLGAIWRHAARQTVDHQTAKHDAPQHLQTHQHAHR
jgi:hypothetical protein